MRHWTVIVLTVGLVWTLGACQDEVPTALDGDLVPVAPTTVEVTLPWAEFATSLVVYGGFGSPLELGFGVVANDFEDVLTSRVLVSPSRYPAVAGVRDTTGTTVQDSAFTFLGGRVVARFDTLAGVPESPVDFSVHAVQSPWDPRTATWTYAVDSVQNQVAWPEPGGGPAVQVGQNTWDPTTGDSVVIVVDSATVAAWGDTTDVFRGIRLDIETTGVRLDVLDVDLRLDSRPSVNPDTIITLNSAPRLLTFIYDPLPEPPPDGIRIGGVPAWRTVVGMQIPTELNGPADLCERVQCPLVLVPERINAASLLLRTRASAPAFQPADTVLVDVRPVLAPDRLPKAPLGSSFVSGGRPLAPEAFGEEPDQLFAVPITSFVRDLVRGETVGGREPPSSIALLSFLEPLSIGFATFSGPGSEDEPVLRLILTTPDTVQIR